MTDNMTSLRIWRPDSGSCRASRRPTWRSIASRTISTAARTRHRPQHDQERLEWVGVRIGARDERDGGVMRERLRIGDDHGRRRERDLDGLGEQLLL